MSLFTLTIGSHFFRANSLGPRAEAAVRDFCNRFVKHGLIKEYGRFKRVPIAVFAARSGDKMEYRFHINAYNDFMGFLEARGIKPELYTTVRLPDYDGDDADMEMDAKLTPLEHQVPVLEYLGQDKPTSKLVGIQTGKGKGYVFMKNMCDIGKRTIVFVKPMYMEKWFVELIEKTDLKKKDIVVIRGEKNLTSLLNLRAAGEMNYKVIIVSNVTMQRWIKDYEKDRYKWKELGWVCTPEEFCQYLGAGLRGTDEVHQDLHLNFKIDLYTHVKQSVALSATFLTDDPFIERMQNLMFPPNDRYSGMALHKYAVAKAYLYHLREGRDYRTTERGSEQYSHNAFEKSIIKQITFRNAYFDMIKEIVDESYVRRRKQGQVGLVFVASIDMATKLVEYFKHCYPHLKIGRYVEDDSDDNLHKSDLVVSTVLSAGTGHDIKGLISVILTQSLKSLQANIQVLGRLREIAGIDVEFCYLVCMDIKKQLEYHEKKVKMLNERAKHLNIIMRQGSV
jgi:superfamily II DNA or RNA helicase